MTRKTPANPAQVAFDSWMLGLEAANVIWLRSMRMMAGGALAEREAKRMVSEKVSAGASLPFALWPLMASGAQPEAVANKTLAHYRKPVRANQRRLSRARK